MEKKEEFSFYQEFEVKSHSNGSKKEVVLELESNVNEGLTRSKSSTTLDAVNYDNLYRILAEYLPEKIYTKKEISFLMVCLLLSVVSSIYYFTFGSTYIHDVGKRWGFDEEEAKFFGHFCGVVSVITNTAINSRSLKQAYDVIKAQIGQKLAAKNEATDDNSSRITTSFFLVLSAIGAIPNEKFVYDATKGSSTVYLAIMEVVQFFVVTALNFRGLHNLITAKFRKERDSRVFVLKKDLLTHINQMLTQPSQLKDKDLEALAHGELVEKRLPWVRSGLGILLWGYTFPYAVAFGNAVKSAMPVPNIGNLLDDLISFTETGCAILSFGLKFVFLGYAYYMFVDKLFSLFDRYLLTTSEHKKVSADFITQTGQRWLALIGGVAALLTLGSSSKIVENYFFDDVEKTAQTFWLALTLGGGAAYGINSGDLLSLFERTINFVVHIFRTMILHYDPTHRFGNTHDEMVMRIMLKVATMPDNEFLKKYTFELTEKDPLPEDLDEQSQQRYKSLKASNDYFHIYTRNNFFGEIVKSSTKLKRVKDNTPLHEFKAKYRQEYEDKLRSEHEHDHPGAPLLSKK